MKLPRITKGFFAAGFVVGAITDAVDFWIQFHDGASQATDWAYKVMLPAAPASLMFMGAGRMDMPPQEPGFMDIIIGISCIALGNGILYGLIGQGIFWVWGRFPSKTSMGEG